MPQAPPPEQTHSPPPPPPPPQTAVCSFAPCRLFQKLHVPRKKERQPAVRFPEDDQQLEEYFLFEVDQPTIYFEKLLVSQRRGRGRHKRRTRTRAVKTDRIPTVASGYEEDDGFWTGSWTMMTKLCHAASSEDTSIPCPGEDTEQHTELAKDSINAA